MKSEDYILLDGNVVVYTSLAAITAVTQFLPHTLKPQKSADSVAKDKVAKAIKALKKEVQELKSAFLDVESIVRQAQYESINLFELANSTFELGSNRVGILDSELSTYCLKLEALSGIANTTIINSAKRLKLLTSVPISPKLEAEIENLIATTNELIRSNGGFKFYSKRFIQISKKLISILDELEENLAKMSELEIND